MTRGPIAFERGLLTDNLLDHLTANLALLASPILVGDGIAPEAGGWTGGQAGVGEFVPYVVLTATPAAVKGPDTLAHGGEGWACGYTLRGVGATRSQMDYAIDKTRLPLLQIEGALEVAGPHWGIVDLAYQSLGGVQRSDATGKIPTFEAVDQFTVWVATRRA